MNLDHLRAFLWLRWRLRVNQLRRGGIANVIILGILTALVVVTAVVLFVTFFLVGLLALPKVPPAVLLYVWDGLVVALVFCWTIGLLTELQRSDSLSLDKFLHLPVSLTGAFLINYLSSFLSVNLVLFVPSMFALCLALVFTRGPIMLLTFPLLAAFLLMLTGVTHQFQGWLASLMVNQRRRRTVIVLVTAGFIIVCQLPNLVNIMRPWGPDRDDAARIVAEGELAELNRVQQAGRLTGEQEQRKEQLEREKQARDERQGETMHQVEQTARVINAVLPPGWLPYGAATAAEGAVVPALLGILGMTLIGSASLWRSYRTTIRLYTGQFTSGKRKVVTPAPVPAKPVRASVGMLEKDLPWMSPQASVIAVASFRSLVRAPEAKMMLLTPIIMVAVFGSMIVANRVTPPDWLRPFVVFGALAMILFGLVPLLGNQFGFDRSGFRTFVLSPARRRDILLGKNVAFAPLAICLGLVVASVVEALYPMRIDYFLSTVPQAISMYLLFCLMTNCLSILAPMPIAPGTLKPANPKVLPILLQAVFIFLFPLALAPTLLPLVIEFALDGLGWGSGMPICLLLSLLECVGIVFLYRIVLTAQGAWLHAKEQKILEIVTTKAE